MLAPFERVSPNIPETGSWSNSLYFRSRMTLWLSFTARTEDLGIQITIWEDLLLKKKKLTFIFCSLPEKKKCKATQQLSC